MVKRYTFPCQVAAIMLIILLIVHLLLILLIVKNCLLYCKNLTDIAIQPIERERKVRGEKLACRLTLLAADTECLLFVSSRS